MKYSVRNNGSTLRARVRVLGAFLPAIMAATGCYRYVPVEPGTVPQAEDVRVRLSETAAQRLAQDFGAYLRTVEGPISAQGSDSLGVSIRLSRFVSGFALEDTRQTLLFDRTEILDISRRQLSVGRTAIATAGVLAGFALLVTTVVQLGDENPGPDEPPPPPPPAGLNRVFSIPLRLGH